VGSPSKGLLETAKEGEIPPFMAKVNKNGVQVTILFIQGVIVSLLAMLYFFMDNVNVAFFVLSAMTITLISGDVHPDVRGGYQAPFHPARPAPFLPGTRRRLGMCLVAGMGLVGVCFALLVGFFPPSNLPVGSPALYVGLVAGGMGVFIGLPLAINALKKPEWRVGRGRASAEDD